MIQMWTPELLSEAPKELFASEKEVPPTVHGWSLVDSNARQEHERIKRLYPHDANEHIQSQTCKPAVYL